MKRYVWININTGQFTDSWENFILWDNAESFLKQDWVQKAKEDGYKLIEYSCLNDEGFEFTNKMKLK
jgi:hypothetical protein